MTTSASTNKEKSAKQIANEQAQADLALYEKKVEGMSHRQLVAELKKKANRGYEGKGFSMNGVDFSELNTGKKIRNRASLDNAFASVLQMILENTRTAPVFEFNQKGNPSRIARPDQIGDGKMLHYIS